MVMTQGTAVVMTQGIFSKTCRTCATFLGIVITEILFSIMLFLQCCQNVGHITHILPKLVFTKKACKMPCRVWHQIGTYSSCVMWPIIDITCSQPTNAWTLPAVRDSCLANANVLRMSVLGLVCVTDAPLPGHV